MTCSITPNYTRSTLHLSNLTLTLLAYAFAIIWRPSSSFTSTFIVCGRKQLSHIFVQEAGEWHNTLPAGVLLTTASGAPRCMPKIIDPGSWKARRPARSVHHSSSNKWKKCTTYNTDIRPLSCVSEFRKRGPGSLTRGLLNSIGELKYVTRDKRCRK